MGIAGDFFKAIKDDGPMAVQMLRVHFNRFMLNKDQKAAYAAITATVKTDTERKEVSCIVPASLPDWKGGKRAEDAKPAGPTPPAA